MFFVDGEEKEKTSKSRIDNRGGRRQNKVYRSFAHVVLWQQPINKSPRFPNDKGVQSSQQWMWIANLGYFDWSDPVTKGRAEVKWSIHQQGTKQRPLLSQQTDAHCIPIRRHVAAPIRRVITATTQHRCPATKHLRPSNCPSIAHTLTQIFSRAHFNPEDKPVWPSHLLHRSLSSPTDAISIMTIRWS